MSGRRITTADLEAYLEEALKPHEMAEIETLLRQQPRLLEQLAQINARRDAGIHTLGEIWRRHRVSCPTREQLGSFVLGVLDEDSRDYVQFHLETVGCRLCFSNLEDLKRRQDESNESVSHRRKRYFQSSAGYLQPDDE